MLTSFTHNCEDILLLRALADVQAGFYIDVGAYDPVMDSVTKIFYDRGWRGLNVEPNPTYLELLRQQRLHDNNVGVAVSDRSGVVEFNVVEGTGLSTIDAKQARQSAAGKHKLSSISVETQTLASLWNTWVPSGQQVHFLKIDVEGAEDKVISGADWIHHRPWILVIEATVPNSSVASHSAWEPTVLDAGYLFAYFDGVNRYYVAEEKRTLLAAFDRPANPMIDNFKPFLAELIERNMQKELDALHERHAEHDDARQAYARLETRNEDLLRMNRLLEEEKRRFDQFHQQVYELRQRVEQLFVDSEKKKSRAIWERVIFRSSGRPRKPFRRMLFHASGKPRGLFFGIIIKKDGRPHKPFLKWMTSSDYQRLRSAVRFDVYSEAVEPLSLETDLSPRARYLFENLDHRLMKSR